MEPVRSEAYFSEAVIVKSKDEFQDLADAFDTMTNELNTQFKLLSVRSDLDHAILSVLDIDQIISTALDCSNSFISYSVMAISILEVENSSPGPLLYM